MLSSKVDLVQKANDAFNNNDMPAFLSYCTEDIIWNMIGSSQTQGKDAILAMMNEMPDATPDILVEDIFATDDKATCTGSFTMPVKEGTAKRYSFCDVYTFEGDKIKSLSSYVVELKS